MLVYGINLKKCGHILTGKLDLIQNRILFAQDATFYANEFNFPKMTNSNS